MIALQVQKAPTKINTVETILNDARVRQRFEGMLKDKAAGFISSVLTIWKQNLSDCDPWSVVQAAGIAAALDLPIINSLGYACIVPYREGGKPYAQFQVMWKGFVQLAVRSGQYETIHASKVYADEVESWNPLTAEFVTTSTQTWKMRKDDKGDGANVAGYVSFFKLSNGYHKFLYMTKDEALAHGKKYSKSFQRGKGRWVEDPEVMCLKTVVKLNLSKWGILSVDLQKAMKYDQAVIAPTEAVEYIDSPQIEAKPDEDEPIAEPQEKKAEPPKDYAAPAQKPK